MFYVSSPLGFIPAGIIREYYIHPPESSSAHLQTQTGCVLTAQTPLLLKFTRLFTKKQNSIQSPPCSAAMVKMMNWHHKASHVIGTKLTCQTMFASCALAVTSTSI